MPRLRRTVRLSWWRTLGAFRSGVHRWRASLQIRVVTSTLVVGTVALLVLGGYLSGWIRDGLFDERVGQLLEESARAAQQAQSNFNAAGTPTPAEVSALMRDLVYRLQSSGSGQPEVFLRRAPGDSPILVNDQVTNEALTGLITPELRAAVQSSDKQTWMSVAIPQPDGVRDPGILVGSLVNVPTAGTYELYFLYSLAAEQRTLAFVQQVLAAAAAGLVALIGVMTFLVTRQAVRPVRGAARVAQRFADGHLSERMTVKGVDEMATLARSFNDMAGSLQDQIGRMEEMSRMQRRFVSDVSHELRTPLTTIRMAAEVLYAARVDLDAGAARSAELLATQLDRFEELLADLLEISRFDAGAAMLDAESVDVRDVVTTAIEQAGPLAQRKGVWLRVELPAERVVADVDPRRVERVLRNLLVNAIEHAEARPVEVRLAQDNRALAVSVRDHGVGMTPEEVAHVFDRFWRADPARARTTGGTGLGLAISIEDAHLHGGRLEAWGREGHGAVFRLTLPLRAGLTIGDPPLPLAPPREPREVAPTDRLGPAAVPDLDPLEAP
ncbi:MtrAB system histidine kinase MtrB [Isoptericola sp. b441]|uniref:Sensor histidine kinase MtrB n=1 Tax=Actinotalea lenta TaxID=3064654 RepID=A0ABT9DCI2_9CELL|nr:MtrAB system histidine kinase MtrB [Isoptericola sp. b441]MDO8108589.1 MtrAB system histidine kinase MtrB [Isoptericola sp. b441]MDO8119999.1 MtrAB system histidine kinase MtrB [Isoptericola sp. b490]